jgi:hypothetical protein
MKIDYVSLGSTDNPEYLDYWPIVSKVWYKKFNIIPVLGLITNEDSDFEKTEYGIIKKFKKPENEDAGLCSQLVRLYLPKFLNGNVLVSDIDMMPLSTKYFVDDIEQFDENKMIVFSSHNEQTNGSNQYPMCYVASSSKTYSEIFDYSLNFENFISSIEHRGWQTDQFFLYKQINLLEKNRIEFPRRVWGHQCARIDRGNWKYDENLLREGYYIDSHLLRPYSPNKQEIDKIANIILND